MSILLFYPPRGGQHLYPDWWVSDGIQTPGLEAVKRGFSCWPGLSLGFPNENPELCALLRGSDGGANPSLAACSGKAFINPTAPAFGGVTGILDAWPGKNAPLLFGSKTLPGLLSLTR